jgi:hypothetical protein
LLGTTMCACPSSVLLCTWAVFSKLQVSEIEREVQVHMRNSTVILDGSPGSGAVDRLSLGFVAQVGNMKREEALQAMSRAHALRQPVLLAVYTYWRNKRVSRGKPLLRSLQAPTGNTDPNPFSVFRYPSGCVPLHPVSEMPSATPPTSLGHSCGRAAPVQVTVNMSAHAPRM